MGHEIVSILYNANYLLFGSIRFLLLSCRNSRIKVFHYLSVACGELAGFSFFFFIFHENLTRTSDMGAYICIFSLTVFIAKSCLPIHVKNYMFHFCENVL